MATVAPPADLNNHTEATDMIKKLTLETPSNALKIPEPAKKASIDSGNGKNSQTSSYGCSMMPLLHDFMDPMVGYTPNYYSGYYYGSYDGAAKQRNDYTRFANPVGVDLSQGVYGDSGAFIYPHYYGYTPYAPYSAAGSPLPAIGQEGKLYQYPFHQPLNARSPPFNPTKSAPVKDNAKTIVNGGIVKGYNNSAPKKQTHQNSTFNSGSLYGFSDPWFGFDSMRSPMPWFDTSSFPNGQQRPITSGSMSSSVLNGKNGPSSKYQNFKPHSPFMGFQPRPMSCLNSNGYMNSMYPNKYGNFGNALGSSFPFGSSCCVAVDNKYRPNGRNNGLYCGSGNENVDGLNELIRGPRARNHITQKPTDEEKETKTSVVADREQYNKPDFTETYADAKFYIIKSYSEDDIHKSIKYGVWSSTPNGNKKLDAAYQEAQQKSGGCPIFLFFSVNTSGQFVGVAEMVGPVDFHKNFEYWQQDKWNGFFPVKWHIVKDVSNSLLKHIILEYNENKPVTNSRDTQEVKLEQGLQMLKIFKDHSSKTCILEDFPFYEGRQKAIQEKKAEQQKFQKQTWEDKPTTDERNKDGIVNGEIKPQTPLTPAADLVEETNGI